MRVITEVPPANCPFIPCANLATAKYYKYNTDDEDIWVLRFEDNNEIRSPYYVAILN